MAQDFAYDFYHSRAWKECRAAFGESRHWLCERCGKPGRIAHHRIYLTPDNIDNPLITLAWTNLELLCWPCHNDEHLVTVQTTRPGFAFDAEGRLVPA